MIEIEMSKDIKSYDPKVFGPLTKRQLICVVIAAGPAYLIVKYCNFIPIEGRLLISLIVCSPLIICAFFKIYGMPFEKFVLHYIIPLILNPTERYYHSVNTLDYLDKEELLLSGEALNDYMRRKAQEQKKAQKKTKKITRASRTKYGCML